jgi:conjugal transfer pilus assembly protein TraK
MNKTIISIFISALFSANLLAADTVTRIKPITTSTEIVRDLKEKDRDAYEKINKSATKSNVITSVVTVADDGTESVVAQDVANSKPKPTSNGKQVEDGLSKSKVDASRSKKRDENLSIVSSESPEILDAMDAHANKKPISAFQEIKKVEPKRTVVKAVKPIGLDREIPESGVRVVEKTNRKEIIEKIIPPTDDVMYGAIQNQYKGERSVASHGTDIDNAIVINAVQGVNEIVTISKNDLNRFVTPFEKLKVRTAAGEDDLVSKVDGNTVYLGATKRSGVFLTEVGSDRAISLTLVPDDIPPRDIYVKLSRSPNIPSSLLKSNKKLGSTFGSNGTNDNDVGKSQSHVDNIKNIMRDLAFGKIPSGYTMTPPKSGEFNCLMPGFRLRLGQSVEGSSTKIMIFKAENTSNFKEAVIDEQYCYKRGVIAVGAWPDTTVAPGNATELFVMLKIDDNQNSESDRPSLIGRETNYSGNLEE